MKLGQDIHNLDSESIDNLPILAMFTQAGIYLHDGFVIYPNTE